MMTPAELWEKHYSYASMNGDYMSKPQFLAALREYGEAVRRIDALIVRTMDCTDKAPPYRVAPGAEYFRAAAAAIEREPLPT